MKNVGGGRNVRQWMLWAFKIQGCQRCGASYPDIALQDLHIHHTNPAQKASWTRKSRSMAEPSGGVIEANSYQLLLTELTQCEVVCADCHRLEHKNHQQLEQPSLFQGTGTAWRMPDSP